jgi:hypothetical protein
LTIAFQVAVLAFQKNLFDQQLLDDDWLNDWLNDWLIIF